MLSPLRGPWPVPVLQLKSGGSSGRVWGGALFGESPDGGKPLHTGTLFIRLDHWVCALGFRPGMLDT